MAQTVRWGVLGTSRHAASTVIPALKAAPSGQVVAIASRDAYRARTYAEEQGIPRSYGSYEALLGDPEIDAVYIPLPNSLHREWTIRAAEAGKHVLCEKPLALNAAEAQEMLEACRRAGVKLAEAFQWRHHPQAQRARELLRQGVIGDLRLIDAGFTFPLSRPNDIRLRPEVGGGALYDVGCYPIAVARYMTGAEPLTVTAQATWTPEGVDETLAATLTFPGGVLAHINCSLRLPLRRYYELVGTGGMLRVNRAYNPKDDAPGEVLQLGDDLAPVATFNTERLNSYVLMAEDFNRALLDGTEVPFPAEDAVLNMRVIDAVYKAARSGGMVMVGETGES